MWVSNILEIIKQKEFLKDAVHRLNALGFVTGYVKLSL
jgi:hypothetical protein